MQKQFYSGLWEHLNKSDWQRMLLIDKERLSGIDFKGKVCLDAGCGHGTVSYIMHKTAKKVYAFDIENMAFVRKIMADRKNVVFVNGSVLDLPFKNNFFDVVHSSGVIHHTINPVKAFNELKRVLKPGGILILGVYGKYGLRTWMIQFFRFIVKPIPEENMKSFLRLFINDKVILWKILDHLYIPIENRFTENDIKGLFKDFKGYRRIKTRKRNYFLNKILYGVDWILVMGVK